MRAVNLLPANHRVGVRSPEQSQERATTIAVAGGALVVVAIAVVMAVMGLHQRTIANDKQATLTGLQSELDAARASTTAISGEQAAISARLTAVSAASSGRVAWDGLLDDLSRVMPPGTWLSDLTAKAPAEPDPNAPPPTVAPTEAAPTAFVITGFARSQSSIPRVLDRLALIPSLSDVALRQSQRVDVGSRKAIQFTIGANVRTEGGNP